MEVVLVILVGAIVVGILSGLIGVKKLDKLALYQQMVDKNV